MKETPRCCWRESLVVCLAVALACSCPLPAISSVPALEVRLEGGGGRSYPLAEIESVTWDGDELHVAASAQADTYALALITYLGFDMGSWTGIDDADDMAAVVQALHLFQNRPNPFSPETRIAFELPQDGPVALRIYSVAGRLVRTLLDEQRHSGSHFELWDGRDESGRAVSSGVYFYELVASGVDEKRRMLLIR